MSSRSMPASCAPPTDLPPHRRLGPITASTYWLPFFEIAMMALRMVNLAPSSFRSFSVIEKGRDGFPCGAIADLDRLCCWSPQSGRLDIIPDQLNLFARRDKRSPPALPDHSRAPQRHQSETP